MPYSRSGSWLWCRKTLSRTVKPLSRMGIFSSLARLFSASTALSLWSTGQSLAQAQLQQDIMAQSTPRLADILQVSIFIGAMSTAIIAAVWLIRERGRISHQNIELNQKLALLAAKDRRREILLSFKDQRIILWAGDNDKPEVIGTMSDETGAPQQRATFLSFGKWLSPQSAAELSLATRNLRKEGKVFDLTIETMAGALLAVHGRISGANALLRFMPLAPIEKELAALRLSNTRNSEALSALQALANALKSPMWIRDSSGALIWVSHAYHALFAQNGEPLPLADLPDILMQESRRDATRAQTAGQSYNAKISSVIHGDRMRFSVVDVAAENHFAGIAIDITRDDALTKAYDQTLKSHAETLDLLTTAIARFDAHKTLVFYNQAFRQLWDLDEAFLSTNPTHVQLIDRLRADGKLAEQPEWRVWKDKLLSDYQALEPVRHMWHLPDGQTLRVVANPQHEGGLTLIFENLTEQYDLESRYKTLVQVRGQTLDHLAEGVAVFSSDGILRLHNPAFAMLWGIDPLSVIDGMHIAALRELMQHHVADDPWMSYIEAVTGFDDIPDESTGRIDLASGTILEAGIAHLPDGQTMLTFVDMTDATNIERALQDKNEALRRSDELKTDFVNHVSYELRSPLNSIIGFTDMLRFGMVGQLNEQQNEYIGHIHSSSEDLLSIVNDILDLATIDAGMLHLDRQSVPVRSAIGDATSQVRDLLAAHQIELEVNTEADPGEMEADLDRLSRVLANLLRNAANYAPTGTAVTLSQKSDADDVLFTIRDEGPGIPQDILSKVFAPFEQRVNGGRTRGVGLGLAIAKSFVDLHNGTIEIDTGQGKGTTILCRLPRKAGPHLPRIG